MQFRDNILRSVPVFTKSGNKLGKLIGFMLDVNHHVVQQYIVARSRSLSRIVSGELLISPSQVISLDDEKMIVDDMVLVLDAAEVAARRPESAMNGVASRTAEQFSLKKRE